jgi:hypothetical protein
MFLALTDDDGLSYEYRAPQNADGFTFVCFNPLTGDKAMWERPGTCAGRRTARSPPEKSVRI